jgi:DNA invertase Pin-like site-specific DNA recombinase
MPATATKNHRVGIYCRLSKDDGTDAESSSIATQKSLLTDYVKRQGWRLVKCYVDDGYSGVSFDRPSFKEMVSDIEAGLIDCVITKDLSRLGRNYLDCGLYLEVFFPEHGVRYLSVNDGVDTLTKGVMDITPFRNILNEMYAADVSVKVKSALRVRFNDGRFTGATPPYGYLKDPAEQGHLIVDEQVRHVVTEIFSLALQGWGVARIRRHLTASRVLRPSAYAEARGDGGYSHLFGGEGDERRWRWSENGVRQILRSPVYAGHLVGYKRPAVSMKSKKRPSRLPEEWEVVENTHEAIIAQRDFDTVQRLMTSRRREPVGEFDNVFAGVVKCADCGYSMRATSANRRKRPDPIDCITYQCNSYSRFGTSECSPHSIEARDLFAAVLADINAQAAEFASDDKAVAQLRQRLQTMGKGEASSLTRERRRLAKRQGELDRLFAALYEDRVSGAVSERNYQMMAERYEAEQEQVASRLAEVDGQMEERGRGERSATDFAALVKGYTGLGRLTAAVVNSLIERVEVGERTENADGKTEQQVSICYKHVGSLGAVTVPVSAIENAPLPPKTCKCCGVEFTPRSGAAKWCDECSPAEKKKAKQRYDRNRKDKRSATHLDEPKTCQRCGTEFLPGSHNARFCPDCKPEAVKAAAKEWRAKDYQRKIRLRTAG